MTNNLSDRGPAAGSLARVLVAMLLGAIATATAAEPVLKPGRKVTLSGKLQGGIVAIGGETTGWRLSYAAGKKPATIEVDMKAIAKPGQFDGAEVTVSGTIVSKDYIERGKVLILIAAKVARKEGANPVKLPGLEINVGEHCVDVDAEICLEHGTLELVACTKDSKEHESIVTIDAKAMHIHTALLLLGAKPGHPAMARAVDEEGTRWVHLPPRGAEVEVLLVVKDKDGKTVERPISEFIKRVDDDVAGDGTAGEAVEKFPTHTFLFAGSQLRGDGKSPRRYLADGSGNVVSLSTFGDEMLCLPGMHGHENGALMWEVDSAQLPAVGTKVVLRLRPKGEGEDSNRERDK